MGHGIVPAMDYIYYELEGVASQEVCRNGHQVRGGNNQSPSDASHGDIMVKGTETEKMDVSSTFVKPEDERSARKRRLSNTGMAKAGPRCSKLSTAEKLAQYFESNSSPLNRSALVDGEYAKKKDGRGRHPTTGIYLGLRQAKEQMLELERELLRVQTERELAESISEKRRTRSVLEEKVTTASIQKANRQEAKTAGDLVVLVRHIAGIIKEMASKSKNLKGTFMRALKDTADSMVHSAEELGVMTSSEKNVRLREENTKIRTEIKSLQKRVLDMKEQMKSLKKEVWRGPRAPAVTEGKMEVEDGRRSLPPPSLEGLKAAAASYLRSNTPDLEKLVQIVTSACVKQADIIIDGRIGAIRDRFPPDSPNQRPPLQNASARGRRDSKSRDRRVSFQAPPDPMEKSKVGKKNGVATTPPPLQPY